MLASLRSRLSSVRLGGVRWIAVAGGVAAVSAFAYVLIHRDADVYTAFTRALAASLLAMAVLGVGERLGRNKPVTNAQADAGGVNAGVNFGEDVAALGEEINRRVTAQMEDVNKRLYDLEKAVFKDRVTGVDGQE